MPPSTGLVPTSESYGLLFWEEVLGLVFVGLSRQVHCGVKTSRCALWFIGYSNGRGRLRLGWVSEVVVSGGYSPDNNAGEHEDRGRNPPGQLPDSPKVSALRLCGFLQ